MPAASNIYLQDVYEINGKYLVVVKQNGSNAKWGWKLFSNVKDLKKDQNHIAISGKQYGNNDFSVIINGIG